jgi:hypothetical protein
MIQIYVHATPPLPRGVLNRGLNRTARFFRTCTRTGTEPFKWRISEPWVWSSNFLITGSQLPQNIVACLSDCRRGLNGNWIYWTHTERDYEHLQSYRVTHSEDQCNYNTHEIFSVIPSRCSVATSNDGCSPLLWVPQLSPASATAAVV